MPPFRVDTDFAPAGDQPAAIEALADKSLIRLATTRVGEMRVNLLETIHAFAGDRLELSGEYDEVQRSHASYFADRVEEAERHLRRAGQVEWTHRLEEERPNLDVALTWSFGSGNPASGLRIVAGLRDFWFYQGHTHDMRQWTTRALSVVGDAEEHVRAGVLMSAGFVAVIIVGMARSLRARDRSLAQNDNPKATLSSTRRWAKSA